MKQIIGLLAAALLTTQVQAQNNSGTITYEQIITLDFSKHPEMEAFAAMIPKEQRSKKILYYTPTATLYKNGQEEPATTNTTSGGANVMIKMDMPEEIVFQDITAGKTYEQKEFMGRQFLITGDVAQNKWKMTGRQKEIAGYPCMQATLIEDKDTLNAWFTSAIPVASGPANMAGLPGMILEINNGDEMKIVAVNIQEGAPDKSLMEKPKAGKKISKEEFEKMVTEKTKEMEQANGGDGDRIIIRREISN